MRSTTGSPQLLEREEVLSRLEDLVAAACGGSGGAMLVEGPAGIGKTAVLASLRTACDRRELRVLRARGALLERGFAFGVVRQLFEQPLAATDAAERDDVLQGAAGLAAQALGLGGREPSEDLGLDPSFAVLHGLYWLCANLAARRPVAIVVDDLQWADLASLRFLAFLLPRLEELPIAVVAAVRTGESGPATDVVRALESDPASEVIELPPLSPTAVRDLVAEGLSADVDPAFVDACHHATGGTPFLLGELVGEMAERQVTPDADGAARLERLGSPAVGRWMLVRLDRLGEDAGRFARALAILETGGTGAVAELAGLDREAAGAAVDALVGAAVVAPTQPLSFVHPIVRAAVYEEVAPGERERGHRRAAELLDAAGGDPARVAEHLMAVSPAGDPWVVDRLAAMGADAARRGAPESAAAYLRRALDEPAGPELRPSLLLTCGMAEEMTGDSLARVHLEAALAEAADDATRAAVAMYLGFTLGRQQEFTEAIDVIERTLEAVAQDGPERLLLEATSAAVGMVSQVTADVGRRRMQRLRERVAAGEAVPAEVLAAASYGAVLENAPAAEAIALARRALDAGATTVPWSQYAAITLVYGGEHAEAIGLLDDAIREAQRTNDGVTYGSAIAQRSMAYVRRGDLLAAEADARSAVDATALPVPSFYRVLGASAGVDALVDRGDLGEAEAMLAQGMELAGKPDAAVTQLVASRGRLRLAQGRLEEALGDLEEAGAMAEATYELGPGANSWRSELSWVLLSLGRRDEALARAREGVTLARAFGAPRAVGLALRAQGNATGGEEGIAMLAEAAEILAGSDSLLPHASTLCDLGAALRRSKRRVESREPLRLALDLAHRVGARAVIERAETELRATGARPRSTMLTGVAALTASERRVAEHAAGGMTNREIAQALFVTARTVEGHLTSVFRKLDLASRDELPAALGE